MLVVRGLLMLLSLVLLLPALLQNLKARRNHQIVLMNRNLPLERGPALMTRKMMRKKEEADLVFSHGVSAETLREVALLRCLSKHPHIVQ